MEDITELFIQILTQAGSLDMAEAEFKKMIGERMGFLDFCEEYVNGREEAWDSLNDFDE